MRAAKSIAGEFKMATSNPVELAAEIVAAFVSYNPVPKSELPSLIEAVHSAVERLEKGLKSAPPQVEAKTPRCRSEGRSPQIS